MAACVVFGLLIQFALDLMATVGVLFTVCEECLAEGWSNRFVNSAMFATV